MVLDFFTKRDDDSLGRIFACQTLTIIITTVVTPTYHPCSSLQRGRPIPGNHRPLPPLRGVGVGPAKVDAPGRYGALEPS